MPRANKKTLSGAPGGAAQTPVDVPYGEGERSLESQRRMPVPDFARSQGSAPSAGGTGGGGSAVPAPADRFAQALQAAQQMAPPDGGLGAPTNRPLEPVTTGLGPGNTPNVGPAFQDALFDLRALSQQYPEYRGLLRLISLAEEQV